MKSLLLNKRLNRWGKPSMKEAQNHFSCKFQARIFHHQETLLPSIQSSWLQQSGCHSWLRQETHLKMDVSQIQKTWLVYLLASLIFKCLDDTWFWFNTISHGVSLYLLSIKKHSWNSFSWAWCWLSQTSLALSSSYGWFPYIKPCSCFILTFCFFSNYISFLDRVI